MVIGRGRKGDVTISTIILIVLGLAVLVMMIVGFSKGWDFIFGNFDNAPSDLQTFAKACVLYAQGNLRIDFCKYNLVGDEILNCRDSRILDSLKADGVNVELSSLDCRTINTFEVTKNACKSLASNKPETKIGALESIPNIEITRGCIQFYKCTGTPSSGAACDTFSTSETCVNGCTWAIPSA